MRRFAQVFAVFLAAAVVVRSENAYRSPEHLAFSPDGAWLAVSDATAGKVILFDGAAGAVRSTVALKGTPRGVAWREGMLYVAEYDAGTVAEVDPGKGTVTRRIGVGPKPWGLAVSGDGALLVVEFGLAQLIAVDPASGKESGRVRVAGLPRYAAVAPDGKTCLVVNSAPSGNAMEGTHACGVSVVDLKTMAKTADIRLPPGSINPRNIAISPDGRWAYVVHGVGRFTLPTTQLERGWIMTSGLTFINMTNMSVHATILLDNITRGAADPWGLALTPDGSTAWVTLSGCGEAMRLDLASLHPLVEGKAPAAALGGIPGQSTWRAIASNPSNRVELINDLAALYTSGAGKAVTLPGRGPRGVAVHPKGDRVVVAEYFSGTLAVCAGPASNQAPRFVSVAVGPQPEADRVRRGEEAFHSADLCFQRWLSCASCHPEGRADGLNWDLLNDGMGNPKNTKSLVWSHKTPPVMAHGVRASMEMATKTGFTFIQFRVVDEAAMEDVREYLRSLEPEKSPYLVNGELSPKARKGKALFESDRTSCARCHPAPLFTDMKIYDVGTRNEVDTRPDFDTPTCVEMWRSAPFMHDGSAPAMMDVLTTRNKADKHGATTRLSGEELECLAEYLMSL